SKYESRLCDSCPLVFYTSVLTQRRKDYLEDSKYFMDVALLAAKRSKDPNTQVGACIVNQENKIVGIGHNRMPNGCDDKLTWDRDRTKDNKHLYVCHAELNAIMNTNGADVKGCSMYVTLFPCNECAKLIIQGGMKEVIYLSDKSTKMKYIASRKMLKKANIETTLRYMSTIFLCCLCNGPLFNCLATILRFVEIATNIQFEHLSKIFNLK
uniref:Deoxycytidylate deaminase n=1 Tax=Labrus bergylta TaxID=56723 RepID=A0A3Q3FFL7_9LABR